MEEKSSWRNKIAGKGVFVHIGLEFSTHLVRRLIALLPGQHERAHLRPLRRLNDREAVSGIRRALRESTCMTPPYGVGGIPFVSPIACRPVAANADEVLEQFERTKSCWKGPCAFSLWQHFLYSHGSISHTSRRSSSWLSAGRKQASHCAARIMTLKWR